MKDRAWWLLQTGSRHPDAEPAGTLREMNADWDRLFAMSVHPTRVEILSAMEWLGSPLLPAQLTAVLEVKKGVGHVVYHMRKMSENGLLRLDSTRPVRGAVEHFYVLV
jgi:hypothetical protein